jgi:hypothetical protein
MNFYRADADQQSLDSTSRITFDFGMRRKAPEVGEQMRDLTVKELENVSGGCTYCTGSCTNVRVVYNANTGEYVTTVSPACSK